MHRVSLFALFLAICCTTCGGGDGSSAGDGSSPYDINMDFEFRDLPPGCPPGVANDIGVGKTCTRGGGECRSSGMQCTCDTVSNLTPPASTPCFCTNVYVQGCSTSSRCGTGATCCPLQQVAGTGIGGCLPDVCLDSNGGCPPIISQ